MQFGLDVPTTGEYADPRVLAQLAGEAEEAGWDGFFLWDVLLGGADMLTNVLDPWIARCSTPCRSPEESGSCSTSIDSDLCSPGRWTG